jgi:Uri superfamily endonuclease
VAADDPRRRATPFIMKSESGTYVLILRNRRKDHVQIGRWREMEIKPGYYIYVGSAFGPGGVHARVSRHCRSSKPKHWHIDFLSEVATPEGAWYSHNPKRLEHEWAHALCGMNELSAIEGFGCTDCNCCSHLFFGVRQPELGQFEKSFGYKVEQWVYSTYR